MSYAVNETHIHPYAHFIRFLLLTLLFEDVLCLIPLVFLYYSPMNVSMDVTLCQKLGEKPQINRKF